jgi:hypothetical protein
LRDEKLQPNRAEQAHPEYAHSGSVGTEIAGEQLEVR